MHCAEHDDDDEMTWAASAGRALPDQNQRLGAEGARTGAEYGAVREADRMDEHPIFKQVQTVVADFVQQVNAAREKACEAALQSGGYGVLEVHDADGSVTFSLSAKVPYGEIHEVWR